MHRRPNQICALAFGSNIGDKPANIDQAITLLDRNTGLSLTRSSSFFKTPPWGYTDQDWFVNACALFETTLAPEDLLKACKDIEQEIGRQKSVRWGPRLIDIDILTLGGTSYSSDSLTIPHPRMRERGFVLVPLNDIAPDLDIGGISVAEAMKNIDVSNIESLVTTHC